MSPVYIEKTPIRNTMYRPPKKMFQIYRREKGAFFTYTTHRISANTPSQPHCQFSVRPTVFLSESSTAQTVPLSCHARDRRTSPQIKTET